MTMKCVAKDRNNNGCRNHIVGDTKFCKYHDYMMDYTEEMLEKCVCCSGCNKMKYLGENEKTCGNCRERAKTNQKMARETVILCKSDGCKFKKSDENDYCMKHQICILVEEVALRNKRLCLNYIRGCREELELDHKYNRCENCLIKDREKDKKRREEVQQYNESIVENISNKKCIVCHKTCPMEMFQGVKGVITKTCGTCRESNKKRDATRDKEHRNALARVAERKPERIAVKNVWKEENYEKVAEKWQKSRNKRIENLGVKEYLKRNAEDAKRWRDNNPEKVAENNELRRQNVNIHYRNYQRSANLKNLQFNLSLDIFVTMVNTPCYYCGQTEDKGFNGIDRMIQTEGYIADNCTSCCQMCNYMKCSLCTDVFLRRIDHILMYNTCINDGELNPDVFMDHMSVSYNDYETRARNKHVEFTLTTEQFHEIVQHNCYICGKTSSNSHKNGIDRYNNMVGYLYENCRACCGECNYMKKHFEYDKMFEKFMQIYQNRIVLWKTEPSIKTSVSDQQNSSMVTTNKKSKDELIEMMNERKRVQQQELKERCGDETYRKHRAQEIANNRRKQTSAGKPEALAEGFSGIMRKDDVGVLVHDDK